ncbi:MAG: CehA/McbA family metallohydrolase [Polyangiaceae bacterium]
MGALLIGAREARADQTLTFDGDLVAGGLDHEFIEFDVPAGVKEIQVDHDDQSADDIIDWGLDDPSGFRGWGGGNGEPAIVGEFAASRSYLARPILPGKWRVVVGKAKIVSPAVHYHVVVTLRDAPTLAAQPERQPYAPTPALAAGPRWYAGDLHAHSRESGDADPSIDELVTFARAEGLDFVELSDHNTVSQLDFIRDTQSKHPDILVLPGVEYTTYAGHANGIGATEWVDHKIGQPGVTIQSAADAFHANGALFSINHPLFDLGNLCIGCSWKHDLPAANVDAVEIVTAATGDLFGAGTLAFWDELCATGKHVAIVGGSDDHSAGQDIGMFGAPVGTPRTFVYAAELSAKGILEGIQSGRTVVKFHGASDPMVELTSDVPLDGDTVRAERTTLRAKITGGGGTSARWVVNGVPEDSVDVDGDAFELTREVASAEGKIDRYRVEVLASGLPATVTSHVWLEFAKGVGADDGGGYHEIAGSGCACAAHGEGDGDASGALVLVTALGALARSRRRRA